MHQLIEWALSVGPATPALIALIVIVAMFVIEEVKRCIREERR